MEKNIDSALVDVTSYTENMHGYDISVWFRSLNKAEKIKYLETLDIETLGLLFAYLEPVWVARALKFIEMEKAIKILEELDGDDLIDVIKCMDLNLRRKILPNLEDYDEIKDLLIYNNDQTGAYTNYEVITVNPDMDVKAATKMMIKNAEDAETISTIFVVDIEEKFLGIVPFQKLIKAKSPLKIEDIMDTITPVLASSDIEETISVIKNYGQDVPVVDDNNVFLGIVSIDDAIDIAEDIVEEDIKKLMIVPEKETKSIWKTAIHRIPWIVVLIILSIPISFLTSGFAKPLAGIAIIVVFQPLLLSTPGNIATQALAVALRELNEKGKLSFKTFLKEFLSAFYTAITLTVIAFVFAFVFMVIKPVSLGPNALVDFGKVKKALLFAGIVSVSLFLVVILASSIAMLIPAFLNKIKQDPAVAAGPFITTIIDIVAVLIYFSITMGLLSHLGVINL